MVKQPIYSVVDLETTGTSSRNGDRIIEIGCVLISEGQVINQFQTKINPGKPIPAVIQQLTSISNDDVAEAPLFDDVAGTIYSLLSETIFVAHNVNFDFPFLNGELERAGYPELEIDAIDTVTLSQILIPDAPGFRLRDLTNYLAIEHDSPHSADSDALATGELLIRLHRKLAAVPTITLQSILKLSIELPFKTNRFFSDELVRRETAKYRLPENLYIKNDLVLVKRGRPISTLTPKKIGFPSSKQAKIKLFGNHLRYRGGQAKIMNMIYNNFVHDEPQNLLIEAGTGIGKTLGYLLPMAYLAYPHQKIIVSTATNILQRQLADTAIQQLNQILPFNITSVVMKGNQHYIDLTRFFRSLSVVGEAMPIQLLKAKILVWLTKTTTGDLSELNLANTNSTYFDEIRHQGLASLDHSSVFFDDDFLVRRQKALVDADVIITNHAYLGQHASELGDSFNPPFLVIDEAQHLSDNILTQTRHAINFQKINTIVNVIKGLVSDSHNRNLTDVFSDSALGDYNLKLIRTDLAELTDAVKQFEQILYRTFMLNTMADSSRTIIEQPIATAELRLLVTGETDTISRLEQVIGNLNLHFNSLDHTFKENYDRWTVSDRYLMNQFESQLSSISTVNDTLAQFTDLFTNQTAESVFWITIHQSRDQSSMILSGRLLTTNQFLSREVYPYFQSPVFTSATLFSSSRSRYIYSQLDINIDQTKSKKIESPFDYQTNARMLIASDAPAISNENYGQYLDYLCTTIYKLAIQNQRQTMILFNSLLTIEQVYAKLRTTDLFSNRDILAQGITGNREKLLKQFSTSENSILLGASSFWEGIDLPEEKLELLIITRLPFDFPDAIITKAENNWLTANGRNPFYSSALPKATLRLRQGIGRLLRTEQDHGVAIVLDRRLNDRRYGQTILKTLPSQLPVETQSTTQLIEETHQFFKKFN